MGVALQMLASRSGCIGGDGAGSGSVGNDECKKPLVSFVAVALPAILYSWSDTLPIPIAFDSRLLLSSLVRFLEFS